MTTIRVKHNKENPYFQFNRATAQTKSISYEALGLLTYLFSRPDDWTVKIADLERTKAGRDKVYGLINELKDRRYIKREQLRNEKGQWHWGEYEVYEQPFPENPDMDLPDLENQEINTVLENQQNTEGQEILDVSLETSMPDASIMPSEGAKNQVIQDNTPDMVEENQSALRKYMGMLQVAESVDTQQNTPNPQGFAAPPSPNEGGYVDNEMLQRINKRLEQPVPFVLPSQSDPTAPIRSVLYRPVQPDMETPKVTPFGEVTRIDTPLNMNRIGFDTTRVKVVTPAPLTPLADSELIAILQAVNTAKTQPEFSRASEVAQAKGYIRKSKKSEEWIITPKGNQFWRETDLTSYEQRMKTPQSPAQLANQALIRALCDHVVGENLRAAGEIQKAINQNLPLKPYFTAENIKSFAAWYRRSYPHLDMVTSPIKFPGKFDQFLKATHLKVTEPTATVVCPFCGGTGQVYDDGIGVWHVCSCQQK